MRWIAAGAFALALAGYLVDIFLGHPFAGGALHVTSINTFYAGMLTMILLAGSRFSLQQSLLAFVGEISYGLYLIHLLCFDLYDRWVGSLWPGLLRAEGRMGLMALRLLMSAGLAIALAWLSRRYFEEPFLRLKDRFPAEPKPDAADDVPLVELAS